MEFREKSSKINSFIMQYLDPCIISVDGYTKQPLEQISLTIFVTKTGPIQYFPTRMFLVPSYTDEVVGRFVRILPNEDPLLGGYYTVKKSMAVIDIVSELEKKYGLEVELARPPSLLLPPLPIHHHNMSESI